MLKHALLLIPRIIIEWIKDIKLLRNRKVQAIPLLKVSDGPDSAYAIKNKLATLPIQALEMYFNHEYPNNSYYNGASAILNRGEPLKLLYYPTEDSFSKLDIKDTMDIVGASLISLKPYTDMYNMYPEELSIALENLENNKLNLTTESAIVLMSFYACCGKGFIWPQKHYKKLLKLYLINLVLKPFQADYRTVIALYCLSVKTNNPIWKLLYILNAWHTPIKKIQDYA